MIVKCAIKFPRLFPIEQIHWRLTRPTQLQRPDGHYEPYIHCNITTVKEDIFGDKIIQISYEMSDESKLKRELEIMHGIIVPIREDLNQRQITEINLNNTGRPINVELVDEILSRGTTL